MAARCRRLRPNADARNAGSSSLRVLTWRAHVANAAAAHAEPPYKRATTRRLCSPGGSRFSAARRTSRWSKTPDRPLMG
jgi:hypothetical protein